MIWIHNSFIVMVWILTTVGLFQIAISPLALASSAVRKDKIETETSASRKLIEEKATNIINLRQKTIPNTTTTTSSSSSSSTFLENNTWLLPNFVGNLFRVLCSWFLEAIQLWNLYWWPSTKIIATPHVDIELFRDAGKLSIINVTNNVSPSLPQPPKIQLQSVVHSIVLQAGGPTSQPSRQPSRLPSSQPTRQPSSRPSRPSGQPSRQPTRYDS